MKVLRMALQVEKYRPTLIKDIVGNQDAVERLQIISEEGNMPNIILSVRSNLTSTWYQHNGVKRTTQDM